MPKEKLFTKDYTLMLATNFLLVYGFWLQMPIMPFYFQETFMDNKTIAGFVISCYTISALITRFFSGYLLDNFKRKPLFLLAFFVFCNVFLLYTSTDNLPLFCFFRILHGFGYGLSAVAANTIVVDILPNSRRGEGLGYFGLANNFSMAFGPLTGILMHNAQFTYHQVFVTGFVCCFVGFLLSCLVKPKSQILAKKQKLKLENIVLLNSITGAIAFVCFAVPYGITTNYVMQYAKEINLEYSNYFFLTMAIGMAVSRIFAGKRVDKGLIIPTIKTGLQLTLACFACLIFVAISNVHLPWLAISLYYLGALLLGTGYGITFPAYNCYFVSLASKERRATAVSTYLTSWDVGLGIGIFFGGMIADYFGGFDSAYIFGEILIIGAYFYFVKVVAKKFEKDRVIE